MEVKLVKQTKVYGKEVKTTLTKIGKYVKTLPESVYEEMSQNGFQPEGPQVWVYNGADGNPETEFSVLVGFPVAMDKMDSKITALEEFKCFGIIHKGAWNKLKDSYCKVVGELTKQGMVMTGESREIYHQVDFENTENNVTEIQIGIK